MTYDLRLSDKFFVSKDIFFDSSVTRKARAVYIALCLLATINSKPSLKRIAKASDYHPQLVSKALKELDELGFVKRSRNSIDLIK